MLGRIGNAISGFFRGKSLEGGWSTIRQAWSSVSEIWSQRNDRELETHYRGVVFACVNKIVTASMEAPLHIGRDTSKGWVDHEDHRLWSLMQQPNPDMDYADFLSHVIIHLELTGCSYIWKWRNRGGKVGELWPLPTSWVTPKRDNAGRLQYYEVWQGNSAGARVDPQDMTRIAYPHPTKPHEHLGPLQAAMREVVVDDERQDYQLEMLVNLRVPGTIYFQPDGWTHEQKEEFRAVIGAGLARGDRGKALFMEGEGAKVEMPRPMQDMDWPGLTTLSETRICAAFNVPPILIGLRSGLESATYSNYEQAARAFYECKMAPLWAKLNAAFTRSLVRDEREAAGLQLYHDTKDVTFLAEDRDKVAERASKLFGVGLIMRNEARNLAGLEPLPAKIGDVFLVPMNLLEVPLSGTRDVTPPAHSGDEDFETPDEDDDEDLVE